MNRLRFGFGFLAACSATDEPKGPAAEAQDPTCVVARGDGFVITNADVQMLRQRYTPPPAVAAAGRLALDVWLGEWVKTGKLRATTIEERLVFHLELANDPIAQRLEALGTARRALHVTTGACWVSGES